MSPCPATRIATRALALVLAAATRIANAAPPPEPAAATAFTSETPAELSAVLDANGDGRPDLIVVEKASGARKLALQLPDGGWQWLAPASTGLDHVSALTIGRFSAGNTDGFAVAAPAWNRVQVFPTPNQDPIPAPSPGIGPGLVAALNLPGSSDDPALDDLVVSSHENGPPDPVVLAGLRWNGAATPGFQDPIPARLTRGNRIRLAATEPWLVGAIRAAGAGSELVALACDDTRCVEAATAQNLPPEAAYAWGRFGPGPESHVVAHAPGGLVLSVRPAQASPGGYEFGPGTQFTLPSPIAAITVLGKTNGDLLLVVFGNGSSAGLFEFDGLHLPTLRQTLTPPDGARFSTANALGHGGFILRHGDRGGDGPSTGWQRWSLEPNESTHRLDASGAIPSAPPGALRANVFIYSDDPATTPNATLRRVLSAGEWSTSATRDATGLSVRSERWRDSDTGLANPALFALGPIAATEFAGLNQSSLASSVACLAPAFGPTFPLVTFSPPPGSYHPPAAEPLSVRLASPNAPGSEIRFRISPQDPWLTYNPETPPAIAASTTFQAYANSGAPSPIQTATYVISTPPPTAPPGAVDANANGMADAWEAAFGLTDPNGDADADGVSNLNEYQGESDPLDPTSKPSSDLLWLAVRPPGPLAPPGSLCEIAWPADRSDAVLETSDTLTPPIPWQPISGPTVNIGGERIYFQPGPPAPAQSNRFFRLRR